MFSTPALAPVKTPASSSSSVAIRSGCAIPRSVAIGSVRNRLVAVVSSTRSPASRCPATSARAAAPMRGRILRLHEAAAQRQPAGARAPGQRRRVEGAELGRRDRAGAIALDDVRLRASKSARSRTPVVHQELAPELVAVAVEQRAVEIEEGQLVPPAPVAPPSPEEAAGGGPAALKGAQVPGLRPHEGLDAVARQRHADARIAVPRPGQARADPVAAVPVDAAGVHLRQAASRARASSRVYMPAVSP